MVRFKNRYLLIELLDPTSLSPLIASISSVHADLPRVLEPTSSLVDADDDESLRIPEVPFVAAGSLEKGKYGDESGGAIHRAVRGSVVDAFGDEGWGRVSSSFRGELGGRCPSPHISQCDARSVTPHRPRAP